MLNILLLLPQTLFISETVFLRYTASKQFVRGSTNIVETLQKRGNRNLRGYCTVYAEYWKPPSISDLQTQRTQRDRDRLK